MYAKILKVERKATVLVNYWNGEGNKANDKLYRKLQANVLYKITFELYITVFKRSLLF